MLSYLYRASILKPIQMFHVEHYPIPYLILDKKFLKPG